MKQTFTLILLILASFHVTAQGLVEYYQASSASKRQQQNLLQMRYGPYLAPQWYLMGEGFVRRDNSRLDQSLGGLLTTRPVTRLGGSVGVGVTFRNKWAVEAGVAFSPVHNQARINSRPPVIMQTRSDGAGAFVRGKWAVLTTSRDWHRSGFWLTGGIWALPNRGVEKEQLTITAYSNRGYDAVDRMTLTSLTQTSSRLTGMLELGAEYQFRVCPKLDMGLFARSNWGLGDALTTNVAYQINNYPAGQTMIRARGNGLSLGLTARYILQRPAKGSQTLYQLQGNSRR